MDDNQQSKNEAYVQVKKKEQTSYEEVGITQAYLRLPCRTTGKARKKDSHYKYVVRSSVLEYADSVVEWVPQVGWWRLQKPLQVATTTSIVGVDMVYTGTPHAGLLSMQMRLPALYISSSSQTSQVLQ